MPFNKSLATCGWKPLQSIYYFIFFQAEFRAVKNQRANYFYLFSQPPVIVFRLSYKAKNYALKANVFDFAV